jgi:CBS domain-containing protein
MELEEIFKFVGAHEPFANLTEPQLARCAKAIRIEYFRRGAVIIDVGAQNLWLNLVRTGAVELQLGGTELEARLGEGDVFGYPSLIGNALTRNRVTALEDCLLYRIPKDVFLALRAQNPTFGQFFIAEESQRLRQAIERLKSVGPDAQLASVFALVRDLLQARRVVRATTKDTIISAAKIMTEQDVSTLLIYENNALVGVLTDKDLRRRVLGAGRDLEGLVTTVMTPNPKTIAAEMPILSALLQMQEMHVHHLPVVEAGEVIGVIGATDLLARMGSNTLQIAGRIRGAASPAAVASALGALPAAVSGLVEAGVDADNVGRFVSSVGEQAHARILALAEAELLAQFGPAPVPYALVAFGSLARSEQALGSDQDNGFIYGAGYDATQHEPYFAALASRLCAGLNAAGYVYCPGNIMASNPNQRKTLADWRAGFDRWITAPDPVAILNCTIFFDMRAVAGQVELVDTLRSEVYALAQKNKIFQSFIARSAANTRIPLGFFRNLLLEHDAVEGNVLNLKTQAIAPIVDIARAHALASGVAEANTHQRLAGAADAGSISAAGAADLRDCFEFIRDVRFRHQAEQIKAGVAASNKLNPENLSRFDREHLRDAFKIIRAQLESLSRTMAGGL